ncbi:RodZ domain-containing protein [Thalassotalea euphylliae]|uniref:DUF4115 domain-containing protein n=1 Tax=Thalassotalea euphylliae TaxID=1655234 RepID=A0A3E0U1N6_9GAMM|nr:RodZ domain-containing protein [Thalassotalea euphylliae]REL30483.1 DUF4115 domain-containing protein [Thalassotalea euphylliae]
MSNTSTELSEDIEVIGPGQMLAEARVAMGLSQQQVAEQLNFRPALVNEIEQEIFDSKLPDTFNRGYLKNYAKLVGVDEQDVLASYEMLGVAAKQRTELQSFSKITEKEAQHSRLMWISYLILAALIASTVLYYLQDASNNALTIEPQPNNGESLSAQNTNQAASLTADNQNLESTTSEPAASNKQVASNIAEPVNEELASEPSLTSSQAAAQPTVQSKPIELAQANADLAQAPIAEPVKVVFSFAGDCWVNIYDGAGERIAWGIKKAGYVMELNGLTPFKVTVGKPELVAIDFNGESIDMSKYNVGNIAKFTLPESS